jgi:hypothetical protein
MRQIVPQHVPAWNSLPDAPSPAQSNAQALGFDAFNQGAGRELNLAPVAPGLRLGFNTRALTTQAGLQTPPQVGSRPKAADFLSKILQPPAHLQQPFHSPLTTGSVISRAGYAASRTIITHDISGKKRPNTSYILNILTAAALHNAYRPYWARSTTATFNDFGSTIGTDAGMNVLHAIQPDLRQIVKSVTPKFVFRIEDRILTHIQPPRDPSLGITH